MTKAAIRLILVLLGMVCLSPVPTASAQVSRTWSGKTPVGEIVAEVPSTARVFELVGIDYCCGGKTALQQAALDSETDFRLLLRALQVVDGKNPGEQKTDLTKLSSKELIKHIVTNYHQKLRTDLPVLVKTTDTVLRVHGSTHPELKEIQTTLSAISKSILPHIDEEEKVTFPLILKLAEGVADDTAKKHLKMIRDDHHQLGHHLLKLRKLTQGFKVPEGACEKYKEMLTGLESLERETLQHVHIENNLLFSRIEKLLNLNHEKNHGK